jgi:hypothetical protein
VECRQKRESRNLLLAWRPAGQRAMFRESGPKPVVCPQGCLQKENKDSSKAEIAAAESSSASRAAVLYLVSPFHDLGARLRLVRAVLIPREANERAGILWMKTTLVSRG